MGWFQKRKERPDAADVAARALVLKAVVVYAFITPPREMMDAMTGAWSELERRKFTNDADAKRDEFWSRLGAWQKHLSPWEREYSRTTMVTMSLRQQTDASWRLEAFGVLAWALGLVESLLPYDAQVPDDRLKTFPPEEPSAFVERARLRPREEIDAARDLAELWHWRARTRQLVESGRPFPDSKEFREAGLSSYDDIVRVAAAKAASEGRIPPLIDGDFPAFGSAFRSLGAAQYAEARSIAAERHFALNWLCGYAPKHEWDETPTDT